MMESKAGNIQPDPVPQGNGREIPVQKTGGNGGDGVEPEKRIKVVTDRSYDKDELLATLEQIEQKANTMFRQAGTPEDKRAFLAIRNLAEGVLRPKQGR